MINRVGQKYGTLTVTALAGSDNGALWQCVCECGKPRCPKTIVVRAAHLASGRTKTCKGQLLPLTGMRFGRLTVIESAGDRKWKCVCDCGNVKIVNDANLGRNTNSCGCLRIEVTIAQDKARSIPIEDRFWRFVDKNGPVPEICPQLGACWIWTGALDQQGYGRKEINGVQVVASRIAWFLVHGSFPQFNACHHCDNPPCVNPGHLFDGDNAANQYDRMVKELGGKPYFDSVHTFE